MSRELDNLRKQIDECDKDLVNLLSRRFAITNKVGLLKQQKEMANVDPAREAKQLRQINRMAKQVGISPLLSKKILSSIIEQVVLDHGAIKRQVKVSTLQSKPRVGIIGLGDFGTLAKKYLQHFCRLRCFDINCKSSKHQLVEVVACEFIILAVPFATMPELLAQIKPLIKESTVLVDVCSVKQKTAELYNKLLPQHKNVVLTHPLFGPQSATNGLEGHTIIFCNSNDACSKRVRKFCEEFLGLRTVAMSAKAHDEIMADMQALTFFVAKVLGEIGIKPNKFQTPSFQMLLDLVSLDKTQSQELYETVQLGNSFAANARQKFVSQVEKLHQELSST